MPNASWPHDDAPDRDASGLIVGALAFLALWLLISQAIAQATSFPYPRALALEFATIGLLHYWITRKLWYKARGTPDPLLTRRHP